MTPMISRTRLRARFLLASMDLNRPPGNSSSIWQSAMIFMQHVLPDYPVSRQ